MKIPVCLCLLISSMHLQGHAGHQTCSLIAGPKGDAIRKTSIRLLKR